MIGPQSPARAKLIGLLVLAAAFAAGGISGIAVDRALGPADAVAGERESDDQQEADADGRAEDDDEDDDRGRRVDLLDRVDLTEAQQQEIRAVRERWHDRVDSFWDTAGPRLRAIADSARTDIRAVLTAEQVERYDSLRAAYRESRHGRDDDDRRDRR